MMSSTKSLGVGRSRPSRPSRRQPRAVALAGSAAAAAVLGLGSAARGQSTDPTNGDTVYAYTGPGTATAPQAGNWNNSNYWVGGIPANASSTELQFGGAGTAAYTSTNDLGPFTLNEIVLNSTSAATNTIAGNALNFVSTQVSNGTVYNPTVVQNGSGAFTIANNITVAAPASNASGSANLIVGGTGTGAVTFSGALTFGAYVNPSTTVNQANAAAMIVNGPGTVNLTGTVTFMGSDVNALNPFTGGLQLNGGTTNIAGGASVLFAPTITPANTTSGVVTNTAPSLRVGGPTGSAVLNVNTTGTVTFVTPDVGGVISPNTASNPTTAAAAGAVYLSNGTFYYNAGITGVSTTTVSNYMQIGSGLTAVGGVGGYGSFNVSGGLLSANGIAGGGGIRVGAVGLGSLVQTGGLIVPARAFTIGTYGAGVATFTGGTFNTASGASASVVAVDEAGGSGTFNLGTEAGGSATFNVLSTQVNQGGTGFTIGGITAASNNGTGVANLNAGKLTLDGTIGGGNTTATGGATLNLNGATLQATASSALIASTAAFPLSTLMYKGGITVDTQAFNSSIAAPLVGATGSGVTPAGGAIPVASLSMLNNINSAPLNNSGFIGPPLVTILDLSRTIAAGNTATGIVTVGNGSITGFALTNPGQGYQAGDALEFNISGGQAGSSSAAFFAQGLYTLQAADLSTNAGGALTKLGAGSLTLTAASTYTGNTNLNAGTIFANTAGATNSSTGAGTVVVASGAKLAGNGYVGGPVSVLSGGTIGAGATNTSVGTLHTAAQTWNAGGAYVAKFTAAAGAVSGNDQLVMSGLTVAATNLSTFSIALSNTSSTAATLSAPAVLVLADDTDTNTSTNPFSPANAAATLAHLTLTVPTTLTSSTGAFALGVQPDTGGGYDLTLMTAAAPEPTSLLLVGTAAAPLALGRRRRRA